LDFRTNFPIDSIEAVALANLESTKNP